VDDLEEINSVLDRLPYGDAPYCVQMILLTGALAENDGRNNFLFSAAVYLKKKYEDGFKNILEEMNGCLEVPLEQRDVDSIYTSVITHGYDNYFCKKSPCADYCDKKLCSLREYGIGRQRNNCFTGADYWGELSKKKESSSAVSFESILDYRQRTGKSEEELTVDDYVFLINNALRAAGFFVTSVVTTCTHFPDGPSEEMVRGYEGPSVEYQFGLFARPEKQWRARTNREGREI
jgi:hypothetical protein